LPGSAVRSSLTPEPANLAQIVGAVHRGPAGASGEGRTKSDDFFTPSKTYTVSSAVAKCREHVAKIEALSGAEGAGNRTVIITAAYTLGGFIGSGAGLGTYEQARSALLGACAKVWGAADDDDERWIDAGLDDGIAKPLIVVPDPETTAPIAALAAGAGTEWPELVPLDPPRTPATFPVDALPGWAAEYVKALAEATQTPLDLPGCCVLGVLAACAGGHAIVEARRGWREPVNLYLLPVLRPGSRKSAVVSAATRPLCEVEKELTGRAAATITETTALRDIAQKAAEKTRKAAANADGNQRDKLTADAISAANLADASKSRWFPGVSPTTSPPKPPRPCSPTTAAE
ncbi:MAG: DUF3987 domain-containing protein, partial [Pseudonocardiaceae bacterium]